MRDENVEWRVNITMQALVRSRAGPSETYGGQIGTRMVSSHGTSIAPRPNHITSAPTLTCVSVLLLSQDQLCEVWEPFCYYHILSYSLGSFLINI